MSARTEVLTTPISPYRLEAPWDAFEFAFHIQEAQANLVILTMAWQTHRDPKLFSRTPKEPDLETLVYWVQRLEPLIRAETEEEIIVVFCNRTGFEGDATYTGTSAVIGIKKGQVFVYGVLGRQEQGLLLVDTSLPPKSKLTDAEGTEVHNHSAEQTVPDSESGPASALGQAPGGAVPGQTLPEESQVRERQLAGPGVEAVPVSPRQPTSPRFPWLAPDPDEEGGTPVDSRSPTRLQIPSKPHFDEYMSMNSAVTDIIVDSPDSPDSSSSFRKLSRPKPSVPASPWRFPHRASPYPWHHLDGQHSSVFGGGAAMTPITPLDEDVWTSTPIDPKPSQWFWKHEPTLSALAETAGEEEDKPRGPSQAPSAQSTQEEKQAPFTRGAQQVSDHETANDRVGIDTDASWGAGQETPEAASPLKNDWAELASVLEELRVRPGSAFDRRSSRADRPSSPKSRNLWGDVTRRSNVYHSSGSVNDKQETSTADVVSPAATLREESADGFGELDNRRVSCNIPRPASSTGHRLGSANNSLDGIARNMLRERRGRRLPSRLRHAVFIPDEPSDDDRLDQQSLGACSSRSESRDRLEEDDDARADPVGEMESRTVMRGDGHGKPPAVHRRSASSWSSTQVQQQGLGVLSLDVRGGEADSSDHSTPRRDRQHPSPLSMEAVARGMASPSLCSATSVSTFDDGPELATPRLSAFAVEPAIAREHGSEQGVPFSGAAVKGGKGDVWFGEQNVEAGGN